MYPLVPLDDVFGSDAWCCLATKWIFVVGLVGAKEGFMQQGMAGLIQVAGAAPPVIQPVLVKTFGFNRRLALIMRV